MTSAEFLVEWALRSSILILSGTLLIWALRVKNPSIRLAAWTALLCGSLAIPAITASLPRITFGKIPFVAGRAPAEAPALPRETSSAPAESPQSDGLLPHAAQIPQHLDWAHAGMAIWSVMALALLLRLCVGVAISLRLLRGSRATGRAMEGIEIRESDRVAAPVTLGIARPAIVLPLDWRDWNGAKLDAVLAHESAHIQRHDPALQLISAMHRALLWHSPMSWFLHRRIVRAAEEASDDAAVAATRDPAFYAEVLLEFMRRGVADADGAGVPMARYGQPGRRIDRILDSRIRDEAVPTRGVTRWAVAAILALGSPLAYVVAAAGPQSAPANGEKPPVAASPSTGQSPDYLACLGSVAAASTVAVKSLVDGQLMSVSFGEGEPVQAGQPLANVDPRAYQIQFDAAEGQAIQDDAQLEDARRTRQFSLALQLEGKVRADQANLARARLNLTYTRITAPITGVAGLRMLDPGNMVHGDSIIVIITQLQPVAVLFNIPEDYLPRVHARLKAGASVPVEAWNRGDTMKIATGRLTAVDNQIDPATGTAKLKAVFDNKDDALFPNQFVNVRLF